MVSRVTDWEAVDHLSVVFRKWEDGTYDKWDAYSEAFAMMNDGRVRLIDIMDAAHKIGISPGVIQMRRQDYL